MGQHMGQVQREELQASQLSFSAPCCLDNMMGLALPFLPQGTLRAAMCPRLLPSVTYWHMDIQRREESMLHHVEDVWFRLG